jgi:fatty-acyl-CoA synthase
MDFHFASAWEIVADKYPNRVATISDDKPLSWKDFERRASCIASLLEEHGLGADSKAGLYLHNCSEYQEAQFGIFKVGGCPINVNYRYKSDELVYLLENSDAEAVFFQSCYAMRIWEIRERLPKVKLSVKGRGGLRASHSHPPAITPPHTKPRRGIYALYRRHYWHAQRCDVPRGSVCAVLFSHGGGRA